MHTHKTLDNKLFGTFSTLQLSKLMQWKTITRESYMPLSPPSLACTYVCRYFCLCVCTERFFDLTIECGNGKQSCLSSCRRLVLLDGLGARCSEIRPVDIQPQSNVQRHHRAHGGCNIDFNLGQTEESVQNKTFQQKERHNGQENDEHAVEKHYFERAVVLRVLGKSKLWD